MSSTGMGTETIVFCTECGCQQAVRTTASGRTRPCQNCAADLRFESEIKCPHCGEGVAWAPELTECPQCRSRFAPGIPLRPKSARSLSRVLTGAMDVAKAKQWEYLELDARRRADELYRAWAALSRNEGDVAVAAESKAPVRPVVAKRAKPGSRRWAVWVGVSVVAILMAWGGVAAWSFMTRQAIEERLAGLSKANLKADVQAVGRFYAGTLVRFQDSYDVPHEKAVRAVRQAFRDYPFVLRFEYKDPRFESVSLGEVSLLVNQEWEFRGNEIYSGSERHRLIWRQEDGEWRIVSQELIKTNWTRKRAPRADGLGGTTAMGVRQ